MNKLPRLCFVGPMVGRNAGYVTTQGEILAACCATAGHQVITVSASPNRYVRLLDIIGTLVLRRNQSDIQCLQVYSGRSFVVVDIASWLGRLLGQRVIMVLHGGAIPEFMASHPRWTCRVLGRADALVAPSAFLARAVERYGFRVRIIPNVVDLAAYPYRRRHALNPQLLWMRAFHPVYNPAMALRVLARVHKILPTATLVMAGQDKGTQNDVQRLARKLGLSDKVRFPGYLDRIDKTREGQNADIFLSTNQVDNMPVSVLEACAMGLPVVATNVGGISDLLTDHETALLVAAEDDEAMAAAVLRLLREPELASRLSTNGRGLAELSSWERVRPEWEGLFASVIASSAG